MVERTYNPGHLLDTLLSKLTLRDDVALARALNVDPSVISKIRQHQLPIGAPILIDMHGLTGLTIRDLRDLMGDRRQKYRLSSTVGNKADRAINNNGEKA